MKAQPDIEEEWNRLNPIFIMGAQRSGTSVMARALHRAGFVGFGEGHLWYELVQPFVRFRDPEYRKNEKHDLYALGAGRNILLEKYIALAIDRFHRDNLPANPIRWFDKSPGSAAVTVGPVLSSIFPRSQFIFMCRNGITAVNSGLRLWFEHPDVFQIVCRHWAVTMSTWRRIRGSLEGRYIEIAQEEMASYPEDTATRLTDFLHIREHRDAIAELFRSYRVNTAFPDKPPGDYSYDIDWSEEQRKYFIQTCGEEMEAWSYSMDLLEPISRPSAGLTRHFPVSTWSSRCRTAWSVLRSDGPLALLGKIGRFLY